MSAGAVPSPHIGGFAARLLRRRAMRLGIPRRRSVPLDRTCGRAAAGSPGRVVTLRWALRNAAAAARGCPSMHETDPTTAPYLSRVEAVVALRALGFPATVKTLATLASRGHRGQPTGALGHVCSTAMPTSSPGPRAGSPRLEQGRGRRAEP
jgi:hypothetical protein